MRTAGKEPDDLPIHTCLPVHTYGVTHTSQGHPSSFSSTQKLVARPRPYHRFDKRESHRSGFGTCTVYISRLWSKVWWELTWFPGVALAELITFSSVARWPARRLPPLRSTYLPLLVLNQQVRRFTPHFTHLPIPATSNNAHFLFMRENPKSARKNTLSQYTWPRRQSIALTTPSVWSTARLISQSG